LFELAPWKDELTESYSHGMRQKLVIASAFVHRPELIVVDEPMVGLDPVGARVLKDLFRAFVRRGGTVLMSTHTLEVVEGMCDEIVILSGGRIAASGTMAEIRAQSAAGDEPLEEIFLRLTGGRRAHELDAVLDA
ncbi:MAG: ATP-binding cassette domain-containing protein, partial [Gemmatimonadota bacterium]